MFAQQAIVVKAKNQSLNKVITALRDQYDVKLSFNDDKLASYVIDVDKSFSSVEDALRFLVKGLPLNIEQVNDVFIITSQRTNPTAKKYLLSCNVIDGRDYETLPFASIVVDGYPLITDQKGNFAYSSTSDSTFNLHISYLGYYKLDTLVGANSNLAIKLFQNSINIQEVVLTGERSEKILDTNYNAGSLKINHTVGQYLPGSSDNSVYNLLRLQPGILAAGEQSNDLIIWGSYRGQTKLSFDGFTVFGLKNFNDNIGAINPLITKDLSIQKGGYGVEQGDRVGGIVNITGVDGGIIKPALKVSVNNLTLNLSASTPLFKNTALMVAGRQTYYNLYNDYSLTPSVNTRNGAKQLIDLTVKPKYNFEDYNLKFSGRSNKGDDYYLSLFKGKDNFSSSYTTNQYNFYINGLNLEKNNQFGGAAFYSKNWAKGGISNITIASSGLNSYTSKNLDLRKPSDNSYKNGTTDLIRNNIRETSIKLTHKLLATKSSNLLLGLGFINNKTTLEQDSLNIQKLNNSYENNRINSFIEDAYFISPRFKITPGIRADYDIELRKVYAQPRFATSYQFNPNFKVSASWGLYNQFIAYNGVVDDEGNFHYQWTVSDGKNVPVYRSQHWVLGSTYQKNQFWFNTDVYLKNTNGITRFVDGRAGRKSIAGDSRAIGIDFLIKKEYKGSMAWISYSLSSTQERFPKKVNKQTIQIYRRAPQDQRHELKFAGVLNLSPFYLSANYVYGSGFPSTNPLENPNTNQLAYHRFDVAATYRFSRKQYHLETGISILNLFNTQNIKASNYERIPAEQNTLNIYSQAVPFTPTLFLKFSL
ncbi:MAG: TonB-dependent receptor [Bacteroidetes bacterium]|nr:TonB-dependent receptor [Bacteroidota bacterium]MBU1373053.1 TonB-dependent receptor [Bacteroidota bacterium]MBU1759353.1 TonB-dependent receptor [Bacteroidota bacterium]MBU2046301.1 TonB-dependent receptor [Bacteroidota bacterium]MBU2268242.1 TonB-dependent receptor [Bacteroidota bacterium]